MIPGPVYAALGIKLRVFVHARPVFCQLSPSPSFYFPFMLAFLLSFSHLCGCWIVVNEHDIIPNLEGTPNIVDRWGNTLSAQLATQKSFGVLPSVSCLPIMQRQQEV